MFNAIKETITDHPIITAIAGLTILGIPVLIWWIWARNN